MVFKTGICRRCKKKKTIETDYSWWHFGLCDKCSDIYAQELNEVENRYRDKEDVIFT